MDPNSDPAIEVLDTGAHTRVTARESIFMGATVRYDGEDGPEAVRIRNISSGGMMVDTAIRRDVGRNVLAELKGLGKIPGRVVWSTEKRTGIAFDAAIDAQQARMKPDLRVAPQTYPQPRIQGRRPGLAIR